jgi:(R,R)-butanediol dehydrogenase/meso-butanediol dehydrogenase/diacetyl reductase
MRAAVVRNGTIIVEEVPRPEAGGDEVVVAVRYCGICGSDVHRFTAGGFPNGAILGHEPCGRIVETGAGVEGWQEGERVVITSYDPCRACRWCLLGEYQLCLSKHWIGLGTHPGGFAEYVKARATMLLRIPDAVDDRTAALTEPLAVALHAVRTAHINLADTVAVIGAGPIGLLALQCLRLAGARAIAVIEVAEKRAALAARLGADAVLAPNDGLPAQVTGALGTPPDVVLDCAGAVPTLQQAAALVRPGGRILLVGVSMKPVPILAIEWGRKEAEMKACIAYRDEFPLALELLGKGLFQVEPLINAVIPLDDVGATITALDRPSDHIKVLVEPLRKEADQ